MAYLTLIDGTQYEGISFGYESDSIGEVVFNTGITGYQELLIALTVRRFTSSVFPARV